MTGAPQRYRICSYLDCRLLEIEQRHFVEASFTELRDEPADVMPIRIERTARENARSK